MSFPNGLCIVPTVDGSGIWTPFWSSKTILIGMLVVEQLKEAGYTVLSASNADEAIALLEKHSEVRFIFTDVDMPGSMDGLKLAAVVRNRWPPIDIIITSGKNTPAAARIPHRSVFLAKPYRVEAVLAAVRCF